MYWYGNYGTVLFSPVPGGGVCEPESQKVAKNIAENNEPGQHVKIPAPALSIQALTIRTVNIVIKM